MFGENIPIKYMTKTGNVIANRVFFRVIHFNNKMYLSEYFLYKITKKNMLISLMVKQFPCVLPLVKKHIKTIQRHHYMFKVRYYSRHSFTIFSIINYQFTDFSDTWNVIVHLDSTYIYFLKQGDSKLAIAFMAILFGI